jgi:histidinol dehydrogenase
MIQLVRYPDKKDWNRLLARPVMEWAAIEQIVAPILADVKKEGDTALRRYNARFDHYEGEALQVQAEEIAAAEALLDQDLKEAIQTAYQNIYRFHQAQQSEVNYIETMPGVHCWRKSLPIRKVGLYIPGGTAPLFSTVLMLGLPAALAGCEERILCSPANAQGQIPPAILYTAQLVGISKIFKVGGAQAIAAMGYGTESIPQVYKIFGPGNQYVTAAKQLLNKEGVAIDMPAGPSEVAVWADASANPAFVAADLLSQAEHGADSQVLLVSDSEALIEAVQKALQEQLPQLPRQQIATAALQNSKAILVENTEIALALINDYAAEHLILALQDARQWAERITDAGSVFIGHYTPESAGDYASGTNHTLPTNGHARAYSGVSLDSFVKKITYQEISQEGIRHIGKAIELMAEAEALFAHKNAVTLRCK